MSLKKVLMIKLALIAYMLVYVVYNPLSVPAVIFYVGAFLNFLEFLVTKGHFYAPVESSGKFYTNKASVFAKMLGDVFHLGRSIYFSVGDVLMGVGIVWSVIWWI